MHALRRDYTGKVKTSTVKHAKYFKFSIAILRVFNFSKLKLDMWQLSAGLPRKPSAPPIPPYHLLSAP